MNIKDKLSKSPINYFSDLFIVAMVVAWISVLLVMTAMAIYATVALQDTSMWAEVGTLVAVPLTAGGAIWLVKCSVQHAIAYNRGERAHMDFPAVNAEGQDDGFEEEFKSAKHRREEGYDEQTDF